MAETAATEAQRVLELGNEVTWTAPWGGGRGIYLGKKRLLSFETGDVLDVSSATRFVVPDAPAAVTPVVVLNSSPITMRTLVFGVCLGNLFAGIVAGVVAAVFYALSHA